MKKMLNMLALCPLLLMLSCEKEEVKPEPEENNIPPSCTVVEVSGTINEPTVWKAGQVYVISGKDVRVTSVLTIEPGVIVKLQDASLDVVGGKIIARGTAQRHIVFTSLADDSYCGDSNGDGMTTGPAKGDWEQIMLNGTTETIFEYADFFYAGKNRGGSNNAVEIAGSNSVSFTFDHCRIAHTLGGSSSASHAFHGSTAMTNPKVSKFTNNALYDNDRPIYFNSFYTLDPSNVFHNPEDPAQQNSRNGIYLYGSILDGIVGWKHTEVPYVLDQSYSIVNSSVISIGADVVVKFMRHGTRLQRQTVNNIIIDPTAILTSYKDDAHGGDTNGDGASTMPAVGDWDGIYNNFNGSQHWDTNPNILYATY